MRVGVVSIQGDFDKHLEALRRLNDPILDPVEVRSPEDLQTVDRLIIPGGESSAVGMLMQRFGLGPAIQEAAQKGMPVWGTCMGMIMMAHSIEQKPDQYTLNLLDISVQRNAFGAQVHSFEHEVEVKGMKGAVMGVFIRAPIVTRCGDGVEPLAEYDGKVVVVRQGNRLGSSFHPEMTDDTRMHRYFVDL